MPEKKYRVIASRVGLSRHEGNAGGGEASIIPRPRRPIDWEGLRGVTEALPRQPEDAATMIRRMRDNERY